MSHIRWKLSGGILILSMGGLVAIADMPKEAPADPPPLQLGLPPAPVEVPPPMVEEAPKVTPAVPPLNFDLPPLELNNPAKPLAVEEPTLELAPMPRKVMRVEAREVAPIPAMPPLPTQPVVNLEPPTQPDPINVAPIEASPLPGIEPEIAPSSLPSNIQQLPVVEEIKPLRQATPIAVPNAEPLRMKSTKPKTIKAEAPQSPKTLDYTISERTLKVLVHMGGDRPWFELRDRDEMYLKVICDNIDVHSPKESDKPVSTIRASGNIRYITPGGQGSCNDLTVSPKDGEVEVKGDVRFRYNWGQVRTTLTAETMTFRLDPIQMNEERSTPMPAGSRKPN